MKKIIPILLLAFIIPQFAFASWWNPFSWEIFGKNEVPVENKIDIGSTNLTSTSNDVSKTKNNEVEKPKKEVAGLKKQVSNNKPKAVVFSTPTPANTAPIVVKPKTFILPSGAVIDDKGNLITPAPIKNQTFILPPTSVSPTPAVVFDACLNLEGVQSYIPAGMQADGNGDCIIPIQTPSPTPIPTPTASSIKATKIENQITNYLQTLNAQIIGLNQNIAIQQLAQSLAPKPTSGCIKGTGAYGQGGCQLAPTQPSFYICVDCSVVAQLSERKNQLNAILIKIQDYGKNETPLSENDISFLASYPISINW